VTRLAMRQIQAIAPSGVGAIFDVLGQSFVTCAIDQWPTGLEEVRSDRLSEILGVPRFLAPPTVPEDQSTRYASFVPELPVVRFPTWLFCAACRRMFQWRRADENTNKDVSCRFCSHGRVKQKLTPMRWVLICPAGHLDDVDWLRFAHSDEPKDHSPQPCRKRDALLFEATSAQGSGLASLRVVCSACRAARSLTDIGGREATRRIGLRCRGRHPWQDPGQESDCAETPLIVQRRAGNVYYAEIRSAIEVPGDGPAELSAVAALSGNPVFRNLVDQLGIDGQDPQTVQDQVLIMFARMLGLTEDALRASLVEATARGRTVQSHTDTDEARIASAEWTALTRPEPWNDPDFVTKVIPIARSASDSTRLRPMDRIDQVTIVQALREVRVHTGFHRVAPQGEQSFVGVDGRRAVAYRPGWLPAVDVRGEGVFVRFGESQLAAWEAREDVRSRVAELEGRVAGSAMATRIRQYTGPVVTARYVLLHTLAHLVIRRMAFESGYGASSLRERVYARSDARGDARYAGFLIYTAAGDAEGTLGGLARQGEMDRLVPLLLSAVEEASWCSADPLCAEQTATSLDGLNMAACHACSLVSETSCENTNLLLDRCLVVGGDQVTGWLDDLVGSAIRPAVGA
jgi:hypothetical protein